MSTSEQDTGGAIWDHPNQQVVREDQSGPGIEYGDSTAAAEETATDPLEGMTKAELLDYAAEHDIQVDEASTKAEIRETIVEAEAE